MPTYYNCLRLIGKEKPREEVTDEFNENKTLPIIADKAIIEQLKEKGLVTGKET